MPQYPDEVEYSEKYEDEVYEYRHVILPKGVAKDMYRITACNRLLADEEWRSLGVQQSRGWAHYEIHRPEPHILLFRRPLFTDPMTGIALEKVLTVRFDLVGEDLLRVSCTSMSGEEAVTLDMSAGDTFAHLLSIISDRVRFPQDRLKLVLSDGMVLQDPTGNEPLGAVLGIGSVGIPTNAHVGEIDS